MKSIIAVYNTLSINANLVSLVSTRIYPYRIAQKATYPAISFQQISNVPYNSKNGFGAKSEKCRIQINSFANNLDVCMDIAEKVRLAMEIQTPFTTNSIFVQGISFESESLMSADNADEEGLFWIMQEYFIYLNR